MTHDLDSESDSYLCDPEDMFCKMRSVARMQRLQDFRQNLLNKLDLGSAPNISTEDLPSQITIESLKKRYGIKDEAITDTDESLLNKELIILAKPVSSSDREKGVRGSYFEFTENERSFRAKKAVLMVYVQPAGKTKRTNVSYINIVKYRTAVNGTKVSLSGPRRKVKMLSNRGHWKKINVLHYVNKWLANEKEERRIRIYAEDDQLLYVDFTDTNSPFRPYIQVSLEKNLMSTSRSKRDITNRDLKAICQSESGVGYCCRHDLHIEFNSVNWNFVIYPRSFNANYCAGPCHSADMHTLRGQLVSATNQNIDEEARGGCCTARELKAINMLYYDHSDNIALATVDNMSISTCGCS